MLCLFFKKSEKNSVHLLKSMVEYKYIIKKGSLYMSKFFTTLTAVDNYGGKSFFSGEGKTEQESIDKALLNKQIGIGNDDEILAIRTYDDISHVKLKHARS